MEIIKKKSVYRIIALVLVGVFVVPIFMNQAVMREIDDSEMTNAGEEQLLTEQIGNMTGASTKEIEELRRQGYGWTEVLEKLQDQRDGMNLDDGVTEDGAYEKILIAQGVELSAIQDAKMAIANVSMLIDEILQSEDGGAVVEANIVKAGPDTGIAQNEEEKLEECRRIANRLDEDYLLYLIFQLQDVLPDMNSVINEYLYALQVDIDIALAIEDYDAYLEEKATRWEGAAILTIQDINLLAIERMNRTNKHVVEDSEESIQTDQGIDMPKVMNPADAIQQELDALNPNK